MQNCRSAWVSCGKTSNNLLYMHNMGVVAWMGGEGGWIADHTSYHCHHASWYYHIASTIPSPLIVSWNCMHVHA